MSGDETPLEAALLLSLTAAAGALLVMTAVGTAKVLLLALTGR